MSHKPLIKLSIIAFTFLLIASRTNFAEGHYSLPPLAPPHAYGNLSISRTSPQNNVLPVTFSHWTHRTRYTCEVCHTELQFNMMVNTSEITHKKQAVGDFCGACHDGTTAFSHQAHCYECHGKDISYYEKDYISFTGKKPLPTTRYGNQIDWVQAVRRGLISPRRFLKQDTYNMTLDRTVELAAEADRIPPAYFPHKEHLEWMSCDMCHPSLFNIKKKGTNNFSMSENLKGRFCGTCHLSVAFPMDDCNRCHPEIRPY